MSTGKLPAIQFYPGDWLRDDVAGCSLAAQGLWLRMMFVMHDSDRYGYLSKLGVPIPPATVAHRCGTTLEQYTTHLLELDRAGVPSRSTEGVIYSRRMVRDAKKREFDRKNGGKGGNPALIRGVNPPLNPPPYPPRYPGAKRKGGLNNSSGEEGTGGKPTRVERVAKLANLGRTS